MIRSPHLFLKALQTKQEEQSATILRKGPEGKWLKDVQIIGHMLRRLSKDVAVVFYSSQNNFDRRLLLTAFEETQELFLALTKQIRRIDATIKNRTDHFGATFQGRTDTQNQPFSEALAAHRSADHKGQTPKEAAEVLTIQGDSTHCD
jgi:gluconate kinase